jgi:hypothetical protein
VWTYSVIPGVVWSFGLFNNAFSTSINKWQIIKDMERWSHGLF